MSMLYVPEGTNSRMKFAYANGKSKFSSKLVRNNKALRLSEKADITRAKFIDEW